jgi:RHS repeat-associated protein
VYYPGSFEPLALVEADGVTGNGNGNDAALTGTDKTNERIYYYCNLPNGCPDRLLDEDGKVVWTARYDAFGKVTKLPTDEVEQPLRLQGQYFDTETGLAYTRFRYYCPETGGFISQDPLGLSAGDNVYAFASNVQKWIDPLGLCKKKPITDPSRLLPAPRGANPHLEGGPMYGVELPAGYRFNQAVGPGQLSPGAFGTPAEIPSVNFVRNDLAVIPDWKPTVSGVRTVEVVRPVRAQISIVGPQEAGGVTYPGGQVQIQALEYDKANPFVKFVGKEKPIK